MNNKTAICIDDHVYVKDVWIAKNNIKNIKPGIYKVIDILDGNRLAIERDGQEYEVSADGVMVGR